MTLVISDSPFLPFLALSFYSPLLSPYYITRRKSNSPTFKDPGLVQQWMYACGPHNRHSLHISYPFFTHVHVFSFSVSTLSTASAHSPSLPFSLGSDLIQHECPFFAFTCLMLGTPRNCSFSLVLTALQFIVDIITQSVQPHHSFIIPPVD